MPYKGGFLALKTKARFVCHDHKAAVRLVAGGQHPVTAGGDTFGQAGGKGQQRRWRLQGLCLGRARRRLLSVCALVCHYNASLRQFFTFCPLVRGRPKAPAVHAFFQTFIFPDHTFGAFISLFARALFTARALAYLRGGLGVVYETHQSARAL